MNTAKLTEEESDWFIEWIQEWSQMLGGCNWYTFHVCQIEFEWDKMMGGVEATVIIFGLGFRWRWNYEETDTMKEIKRRRDDVMSGKAKTVPIDDIYKE